MIIELDKNSIKICNYGCNKIAKFILNNGKFCCENHYNKCEFQRDKQSKKQKGRKLSIERIQIIKESVIKRMNHESKEERKKYASKKRTISSILKLCPKFLEYEEIKEDNNLLYGHCSNPNCKNSKEQNGWFLLTGRKIETRLEHINKQKYNCSKFYCSEKCKNKDPNRENFISKVLLNYYKNLPEEERNIKFIYPRRITIEQIKIRYPNFYKEEEIRYKPGEEFKRIIQGRCKNLNCKNSKEKNGWFDLDRRQLEGRISSLENKLIKAKLYFFCCDDCKVESKLFSRKPGSLQENKEYTKYSKEVWRLTYHSVKKNYNKISNIKLRGLKNKYDLDHKYSIWEGFNNNLDPKIISHWINLEVISQFNNRSKHKKSSISLKNLKDIICKEDIKDEI